MMAKRTRRRLSAFKTNVAEIKCSRSEKEECTRERERMKEKKDQIKKQRKRNCVCAFFITLDPSIYMYIESDLHKQSIMQKIHTENKFYSFLTYFFFFAFCFVGTFFIWLLFVPAVWLCVQRYKRYTSSCRGMRSDVICTVLQVHIHIYIYRYVQTNERMLW